MNANKTLLFSGLFVCLGLPFVSAAKYLFELPGLFSVVFVARILVLLLVLVCCYLAARIFLGITKIQGINKQSVAITISICSAAIVAIVMFFMSIGNEISDGLRQLYFMRQTN